MLRERIQNLFYLADRTAAEYIVAVKLMKIADKRIALMEREGKHMCLERACAEPVIGKVFTHCQEHLSDSEKEWFEKDVETNGFDVLAVGPWGGNLVQMSIAHAKRNVALLEETLQDAYRTSKTFWDQRRDRLGLVPAQLLNRLQAAEVRLFDVDQEWFYDKQ